MRGDNILRAQARELIQAGKLPHRLPSRMWGGPGMGTPCLVCSAPVGHNQTGLEVEFTCDGGHSASTHHFHVHCFSALEFELREMELAKRPIPARGQMESATASRADEL
jgi:hypothetical protein